MAMKAGAVKYGLGVGRVWLSLGSVVGAWLRETQAKSGFGQQGVT
jgi:hypothetical protein